MGGRITSPSTMIGDGKMRLFLSTSSMTTDKPPTGDGHILHFGWDNPSGWDNQIAIGDNGHMASRSGRGSGNTTTNTQSWTNWFVQLDSNNYNNYAPTKTGGGASGTWSINISGNSATTSSCSSNNLTNIAFNWASSYTTGDWMLIHNGETGPNGGQLFRTINQTNTAAWVQGGASGTWNITAVKATQDSDGHNIKDNYNKATIQEVDLTSYSTNTWYPVTIGLPYNGLSRVSCIVQLNSGHKPSWASHSSGYTAVVEMLINASGWGTTAAYTICLINDQRWINSGEQVPVGYSQFTNSSRACFWCRGGAKYRLLTDFFGTWTTYTSSTTVSSQTIAPTTTYPGINFTRSMIISNLTGTVTAPSSLEVKNNIKEIERDIEDKLDLLNPVSFIYNEDEENRLRYGFIYEDMVDIFPNLCFENSGEKTISYIDLIPLLIKEIQSLKEKIKSLENK